MKKKKIQIVEVEYDMDADQETEFMYGSADYEEYSDDIVSMYGDGNYLSFFEWMLTAK